MSNKIIKTVFAGTSDFGIPSLEALAASGIFKIKEIITQPDKKAGRGQQLAQPAVKTAGLKYGIPVRQPGNISDYSLPTGIDLLVVIAYGQIIPEALLSLPKFGAVNLHGSLLPKYRGAACIQAAIMNGDKKTGITIIKMDAGIDTGPVLFKKEMEISPADTGGSLYQKLSALGGGQIAAALRGYVGGKIKPQAQNNAQASYVKKLEKKDGQIDFSQPAGKVESFIRAMHPWPGSFARLDGKIIKILKADPTPLNINDFKPGEIIINGNKLVLQCGQNALEVLELQLAGKKPLLARDFIQGYANLAGKILN